jgi:hypothetical protein
MPPHLQPGIRFMKRAHRVSLSILAPATLVAAAMLTATHAGGSVGLTPSTGDALFGPGESLTYRVRYGILDTGKARIEVGAGQQTEGTDVWPIVVDAQTNPTFRRIYDLENHFVTHYVPEEGRSLGFDQDAVERGERRTTRVRLDSAAQKAEVTRRRPGEPVERRTYDVGPAEHDIASAIFYLRSRPLAVGDVERVRVFTGRKAWDMVATVVGPDRVRLPSGHFRTKRVRIQTAFDGKAAARRDIEVWMTDDAFHVPVAMRADLAVGSLRAELLEYTPPSIYQTGE